MYLRSKMLIRPLQKRRRNDWKKEVLRRMNEKGKCAILEREKEVGASWTVWRGFVVPCAAN